MNEREMQQKTRIDLPLLLPDVTDERDQCVGRLTALLREHPGVIDAHVLLPGEVDGNKEMVRTTPDVDSSTDARPFPVLCLHYDAERLTLREVNALAHAAGADLTGQFAHLLAPIHAITTEDDGQRIERSVAELPGITHVSVSLAGQVARVEYDRGQTTADAVSRQLQRLFPLPRKDSWYARNRELTWSVASGALLLGAFLLERSGAGDARITLALFVGAYVFGARDNVGHFVADLRRGKFHFNIDLLMVVAAVGAAVLGEWAEGALLLFLFSLGHALESYAMGRARIAIKALAELAPQTALVRRNGRDVLVPIGEVKPGDHVVVKPAERLPVDGTVLDGRSGVNQAPITGESVPVDKAPGDTVFAGTVNGEGALVINVTVAVGDRTLDRVIKLVSEAQTQKAPTQQFTERFARVFVPIVLVGDVALILVPPLLGLLSWSEAFARAMAVLVAASPCALALGTPAAVLSGIAQAARNGVLIKGGAFLEALGSIKSLALDKTGTITVGEPSVTDVVPMDGVDEAMLLTNAAAVEQRSQHPLAKAVVHAAATRQLRLPPTGDMTSITARGVRAPVDGMIVEVGRSLLFEDAGVVVPIAVRDVVVRLEKAGRSTMIVRRVGHAPEFLGVLGLADQPRGNARETLVALRAVGISRIIMLTGDNAGVASAVAAAVGIDSVRAGLLPEDKVAAIRELAAEGPVAMVGDGVNDAPALAHATVGIAMGGAGTAAALETADIALMGDDLSRLPFAIGLSRQSARVIRQNLYVSLGVIAALVVATVSGTTGIGVAVIVHEGSTLAVIANALRLLRYGGSSAAGRRERQLNPS
jgi:Zn2+/Cd2+-exporting ATPase